LNVFYSASDAMLSGIPTSEDDIYSYAPAFRESEQFVSVTINTVAVNEDGTIGFIMYITW